MDELGNRRQFLAATGTALAVGLAGCTGDGGDGGGGDGGDGGSDGGDGGSGGSSLEVSSDAQSRVETFLTAEPAASNYDSITSMGGMGSVTVDVGAEGNQGNYAFAPAAIAVETGTTINWEWTGKGSTHNVVSTGETDFDFDSGTAKEEDSFSQTFEEAGVALYHCVPHKSLGMKGAVVVVDSA
jgi:halocyanin-like protein